MKENLKTFFLKDKKEEKKEEGIRIETCNVLLNQMILIFLLALEHFFEIHSFYSHKAVNSYRSKLTVNKKPANISWH